MIFNRENGDTDVIFGNGSVIISHVEGLGEEKCIGLRLNWAKGPHNIGDDAPCENVFDGDDVVYAHPSVNLLFYKKESVDVLINKLEEVKEIWDEDEDSSI